MSFQAMAWAVQQKLPSREKLLLLMVANYADENGKCWPSNGRLVDDTGFSKSTILLAFKALEDRGLIAIKRRSVEGVSLSNMYYLNLTGGSTTAAPPVRDEEEDTPLFEGGVVREPDGGGTRAGPKPINEPINKPIKDSCARSFDKFWVAYPRKTAKGAAEKAWEKACSLADPDLIISAVDRAEWPNDPQYIPHASTWLNQKRWLDEAPTRIMTLAEQYAQKAILAAQDESDIDNDLLIYRGE